MEILIKLKDTVYGLLIILISFLPVSFIATLLKTLINLKNKAGLDFRDYLMEFLISVLLACFIAYLCETYLGTDNKTNLIVASLVGWNGSKLKSLIDSLIDKYLSKFNNN